jgi:hypothetical protein
MMSAWLSPVCGRAFTMLSIFTASTGPRDVTGSPVNGEVSGRCSGPLGCAAGLTGTGLARNANRAVTTGRRPPRRSAPQ